MAERLPNGHILAPVTFRYTDPETGALYLGEGQRELAPGDPDYDEYEHILNASSG